MNATGARVWLRALAISGMAWGGIGLALMAAMYVQSLRAQSRATLIELLQSGVLPFLPLFLFSLVTLVILGRRERRPPSWRRLILAAPLILISLLLLELSWEGVLDALRNGKPLSSAIDFVLGLPAYWVWMDFVLVCAALLLHVALLFWDSNRERQRALLESERRNIQLRLEMLQGQLEPHFLFNALNTISSLVRAADRERATRALAEVSDLLRHALRASQGGWLSVQDEIEFSRHYLHLQQMRFEDRLQIQWHCDDEDWSAIACPPMLMQPLLENAVKHGLESHEDACDVVVEVRRLDTDVHIRISNPLPPADASNAGHGVGLAATRERLQLLFAERASFSAQAVAGRFIAALSFPVEGGQ